MKILITTFTYAPNADGCAEAATVLARGLAALGHTVTVTTAFHPQRIPSQPADNPQVVQFKIPMRSDLRNCPAEEKREIQAYQDFIGNFAGDIIITECWDMWNMALVESLLPQLKARKILVSHGYTPHIWNPYPKFAWGLGQWLRGWPLVARTPRLMRQMDHLVVLSRRRNFGRFFDHKLAGWFGIRHCSVIPNGAHAEEFNDPTLPDFRLDFGIGPGPMFLCVANYSDRKNQLLAVRAFRQARLADATLVLIGSEFNDYAAQVRQVDVSMQKDFPTGHVVLLEKLNRRQTCAAYRAADLFVLPAKAETQPIVLMEAMASHTPWVSTDTGCVSELPGGLVVRSETELVEKIRSLATDPDLRQKLAAEGWAACQQTYDWKQVVAAYDRLIRKVCGQG